jgi:hypothetical protein
MQRRFSRRIQDRKKLDEKGEESPLTDLDDDQPVSPPKKRQRKAKVVEPVVYDILPVESKTTTYQGVCFAAILGKKISHLSRTSGLCELLVCVTVFCFLNLEWS